MKQKEHNLQGMKRHGHIRRLPPPTPSRLRRDVSSSAAAEETQRMPPHPTSSSRFPFTNLVKDFLGREGKISFYPVAAAATREKPKLQTPNELDPGQNMLYI
ncbi:hypothetical protein V6N13_078334 [Hibiscus sabdariffa]|uniref:Uncharacterized protein n=1 Tax=Hibiscus sabdariffa TaxID=183260 RepID=A0ABR2RNS2_9ROSI